MISTDRYTFKALPRSKIYSAMIAMTRSLNISHARVGDSYNSKVRRGVTWEWRSMIHKGVQLVLSGRRLRLGQYSTACRLVDRKKTNTEFNKLTKQVERA